MLSLDLDYELLALSLPPHYLPREFPKINLIVIYILPDANKQHASKQIADVTNYLLDKSPDSVVLITRDFNHQTLEHDLPTFHQYIDCPTRGDATLDVCYGNIAEAYKCRLLPQLGKSDHNMIHLMPKYRPLLKREKPRKKEVNTWSEDCGKKLRSCFECPDWEIFIGPYHDLDLEELNDTVTECIEFCENLVIEKKDIFVYNNTKPWPRKELRKALLEKSIAFRSRDKDALEECTGTVKELVRKCKRDYKVKVEENIRKSPKSAWDGLKATAGCPRKKTLLIIEGDGTSYANDLNTFYTRFDVYDFKGERDLRMKDILEGLENDKDIKGLFTGRRWDRPTGGLGARLRPRSWSSCGPGNWVSGRRRRRRRRVPLRWHVEAVVVEVVVVVVVVVAVVAAAAVVIVVVVVVVVVVVETSVAVVAVVIVVVAVEVALAVEVVVVVVVSKSIFLKGSITDTNVRCGPKNMPRGIASNGEVSYSVTNLDSTLSMLMAVFVYGEEAVKDTKQIALESTTGGAEHISMGRRCAAVIEAQGGHIHY
ncbi:hypothetical protein ElyMa_005354600 [Elysia marginata]|uniref:Uncharacterized protein n=1 Tax=Elysia marginata TaxID=1093978 RepID=A0AAV4EBQ1_9GAST|nr:hypothetical protein ElyMa_005354600 [Elysia marginata]